MSDKAECNHCEIKIERIEAEGRGWTEIVSYVPDSNIVPYISLWNLSAVQGPNYNTIKIYYCDKCWHQQQSRMFG